MPNLLDYLSWRGDLSLAAVPLQEIDLLVLSRAAYLPFDDIVPAAFILPRVTLGEAARRVLERARAEHTPFPLHMREDEALIEHLIGSPRFAGLELAGYWNRFDAARQEQFSAVSFFLPSGGAVVAFRGTDGTLVGWKEDFRMSFEEAVTAQLDAVEYVEALARACDGPLNLAGHSKGGNLAVYAAAFCTPHTQMRVHTVCNFDGPGFQEHVIRTEEIRRVIDRVHTYLPQSSIIGMLLEHAEDFTIIQSESVSIFQHDVYLWQIRRDSFITMETHTSSSRYIDGTLKEWLNDMQPSLREKIVDGLFEIAAAGGDTLRDIARGRGILALLRATGDADAETRAAIREGMRLLVQAARDTLPGLRAAQENEPSRSWLEEIKLLIGHDAPDDQPAQ